MKIIGIAIFAAAMWLTWDWVKVATDKRWDLHVQLQIEMEELIHSAVAKHRPDAKNIRVHQVWSEPMKNDRIKVFFNYSFQEPSADENTDQTIRGYAILAEIKKPDMTEPAWSVEEVKAQNAEIIFENGLTVTPNSSENAQ